jgi:hypothetical protein
MALRLRRAVTMHIKHLTELGILGMLMTAATLGAQSNRASSPPSPPPTPPAAQRALTVTGCVQLDETHGGAFTLSDKRTGTKYRLTGSDLKAYTWRNVRIVGGLVPSANLAAQAGAIDPTKAAMASQGGNPGAPGSADIAEFNVARVRRLTGSCAPPAK